MNQRGGKDYERSARVGELMREILAVEIDNIDDRRLWSVAVTAVEVDNELEKAVVFVDADDGEVALGALEDHVGVLRRAVSRQARIRRTPRLEFKVDGSVGTGNRIEDILSTLDIPPEAKPVAGEAVETVAGVAEAIETAAGAAEAIEAKPVAGEAIEPESKNGA
ncbi:MAG: 30S ribosome-binding factor RbfA [Actinobacteria bacterium]|nr:30S ribosome-binding factor RbfA [Actinomycetota bacterium]